ncbi:hypothetical protein EJB05_52308, partial [Eragrostis curvula]
MDNFFQLLCILRHDRMLTQTFGPANTTPLISAAMRGHIEVVRLLLEQDDFGLIEMAKDNGKNALHFAILLSMFDQNEFFKPWIVLDYSENNCGMEWKVGPFSEF